MSDHTKLATARVADFLSERGWAAEFVADVLAKSPQHVKINGAHAIELVASALRAAPEARPLDEWHEDMGAVTWWRFPVEEAAWIGTPLDSDWPGYHTHWTPHPAIPAMLAARPQEAE